MKQQEMYKGVKSHVKSWKAAKELEDFSKQKEEKAEFPKI